MIGDGGFEDLSVFAFGYYDLENDVDVIEVNRVHDDNGREVFTQVIYYDWDWRWGRYQVRDWRMVKAPHSWPIGTEQLWLDGHTLRRITARQRCDTWTGHDPELIEREMCPQDYRKRLLKVER